MYSDRECSADPSRRPADHVRRRVVEAASDTRFPMRSAGRSHLDVHLSLLQDRLPVYVRTMEEILGNAGRADVHKNLVLIAQATIDFYEALLPSKASVLADPAQLVQYREMMRSRGIGQQQAEKAVACYLNRERELGRLGARVDVLAAARTLLNGCLGYAFNRLLMGREDQPSPEEYADGLVGGLRLNS